MVLGSFHIIIWKQSQYSGRNAEPLREELVGAKDSSGEYTERGGANNCPEDACRQELYRWTCLLYTSHCLRNGYKSPALCAAIPFAVQLWNQFAYLRRGRCSAHMPNAFVSIYNTLLFKWTLYTTHIYLLELELFEAVLFRTCYW